MKAFKVVAMIVLAVLTVFFFGKFREDYGRTGSLTEQRLGRYDLVSTEPTNGVVEAGEPAGGDGAPAQEGAARGSGGTNGLSAATHSVTGAVAGGITGVMAAGTSGMPTGSTASVSVAAAAAVPGGERSNLWGVYLGAFLVTLIGLGGLAGWEFSRWVATRAHAGVFDEDRGVEKDPEYDAAEAAAASGQFIEAVTLLREYQRKNPTELHVPLRIAEIYEKDLHNPLAASMELEEVLGAKLPRERWGWTAIHLSNLYSGPLGQPEKALAILNRVIEEYPETGAARKARTRLGVPEPESVGAAGEGGSDGVEAVEAVEPVDESPSNLPRGFRPKR